MDRTLMLLDREGDLHAQLEFIYNDLTQTEMKCTLYDKVYIGAEKGIKMASIIPLSMHIYPLPFTKFGSVREIRLHDIALVKNELKDIIKDTKGFIFTYAEDVALHRYLIPYENKCLAIVDCHSNFLENTKTIKFISAISPRYDITAAGNSLECNIEAILNLPNPEAAKQPIGDTLKPEDIRRLQ
jgi:hypothetical protein